MIFRFFKNTETHHLLHVKIGCFLVPSRFFQHADQHLEHQSRRVLLRETFHQPIRHPCIPTYLLLCSQEIPKEFRVVEVLFVLSCNLVSKYPGLLYLTRDGHRVLYNWKARKNADSKYIFSFCPRGLVFEKNYVKIWMTIMTCQGSKL